MSAIVCGKRSSSAFEELLHTTPPPASKRIRCSAALSTSPNAALSSPNSYYYSPSPDQGGGVWSPPLAHLRYLFPDMDLQLLERALEECGNDLDSAIKSLNDLRLESMEGNSVSAVSNSDAGIKTDIQPGIVVSDAKGPFSEIPPAADILPTDGSGWVELFVGELRNAADVDDARARASRLLGVLERAITANAGTEALQTLNKESTILKEQVEVLLRENTILKRGVAIQYERQKEYDERSQEFENLKQLLSQYQEQVRMLEVSNYTLSMHLRQAQQSSSIPGRFHPDVF